MILCVKTDIINNAIDLKQLYLIQEYAYSIIIVAKNCLYIFSYPKKNGKLVIKTTITPLPKLLDFNFLVILTNNVIHKKSSIIKAKKVDSVSK